MLIEIPDEMLEADEKAPTLVDAIEATDIIIEHVRHQLRQKRDQANQRSNTAVVVTVSDPNTGETLESNEIQDDYVLVTAGSCELHYTNVYPTTGTVQLTIKGRA